MLLSTCTSLGFDDPMERNFLYLARSMLCLWTAFLPHLTFRRMASSSSSSSSRWIWICESEWSPAGRGHASAAAGAAYPGARVPIEGEHCAAGQGRFLLARTCSMGGVAVFVACERWIRDIGRIFKFENPLSIIQDASTKIRAGTRTSPLPVNHYDHDPKRKKITPDETVQSMGWCTMYSFFPHEFWK